MNHRNHSRFFRFYPLLLVFALSSSASAKNEEKRESPRDSEIQVTLLGQPCFLKGPFDKDTLKAIHAIGPAQLPEISLSQLPGTKDRFQKALDQVKSARGIPTLLDSYREKLGRRLEAQTEIIKALIRFKQNRNISEVMKTAKTYLPEEKLKGFQALLTKKSSSSNPSEELMQNYNDGIEADPEQEFHRITNDKMHLQYACSFDEAGETPDESPDESPGPSHGK